MALGIGICGSWGSMLIQVVTRGFPTSLHAPPRNTGTIKNMGCQEKDWIYKTQKTVVKAPFTGRQTAI